MCFRHLFVSLCPSAFNITWDQRQWWKPITLGEEWKWINSILQVRAYDKSSNFRRQKWRARSMPHKAQTLANSLINRLQLIDAGYYLTAWAVMMMRLGSVFPSNESLCAWLAASVQWRELSLAGFKRNVWDFHVEIHKTIPAMENFKALEPGNKRNSQLFELARLCQHSSGLLDGRRIHQRVWRHRNLRHLGSAMCPPAAPVIVVSGQTMNKQAKYVLLQYIFGKTTTKMRMTANSCLKVWEWSTNTQYPEVQR